MKLLLETAEEKTLAQLFQEKGVDFPLPCGGTRGCGKCKLLVRGDLLPLSPEEAALLSPSEIRAGVRLACFARVCGRAEAILPEAELFAGTNAARFVFPGEDLPENVFWGTEPVCVVDLGTTTVVSTLFDGTGRLLTQRTAANPGRVYGADVLSRIQHATAHGVTLHQKPLLSLVEEELCALCAACGLPRGQLRRGAVTGNTAMLHFFAGLDVRGLGRAPFHSASLFDCWREDLLPGLTLYLPPCAGPFFGADALCGLLESHLREQPAPILFLDLGTNGELALWQGDTFLCCSTAAGPAFEGWGLRFGLPAVEGAICWLASRLQAGHPVWRSIGTGPARGFCGSGLVDCLALLLNEGALREDGLLEGKGALAPCIRECEGERAFFLPETEICLTQGEIHSLQYAKAAVGAALETLLAETGGTPSQLKGLFLAGAFGEGLDVASARRIGLLPRNLGGEVRALGNTALFGAKTALLFPEARETLRQIAGCCQVLQLADTPRFAETYLRCLSFPVEADKNAI